MSATPEIGTLQERAEKLAERIPLGGPVDDFERVGRMQLDVLLREGMTKESKILDIGCGALRAGYWLIHYLDPGGYYGIEPYHEMLDAAKAELLEPGLLEEKRPHFDDNRDYDFGVFGQSFDFFLARSIWSHATSGEIGRMLDAVQKSASPKAVMLVSYFRFPPRLSASLNFAGAIALAKRDIVFAKYPKLRQTVTERVGRRWAGYDKPMPGDADTRSLPPDMIPHTLNGIRKLCTARGLTVRELDYGYANCQFWLRIERA